MGNSLLVGAVSESGEHVPQLHADAWPCWQAPQSNFPSGEGAQAPQAHIAGVGRPASEPLEYVWPNPIGGW